MKGLFFSVMDGCIIDNNFWFSNNSFNCIGRLDLNSNKTTIEGIFMNKNSWEGGNHRKAIHCGDKIFFVNNVFDGIDVYDYKHKKQEFYKIPVDLQNNECVSNAYLVDDKIYIFPVKFGSDVIIFDINKSEFYVDKYIKEILLQLNSSGVAFTYGSITKKDDVIWLAPLRGHSIVKYKAKEGKADIINIGINDIYGIEISQFLVITTFSEKKTYFCNLDNYSIIKTICYDNLLKYDLFKPFVCDNEIIVLTDKMMKEKEYIGLDLAKELEGVLELPYIKTFSYKDYQFFMPYYSNKIIKRKRGSDVFDILDWAVEDFERLHEFTDVKKMMHNYLIRENFKESIRLSLDNYLQMIITDGEKVF